MVSFICLVVGLAGGFGLGRIKNAKKLATVRAELNQAELGVQAEGKAIIARVRSIIK